jgi:hypothetical protein
MATPAAVIRSRWRERYRPVIAACLAGLPAEADRRQCERALYPLYPDGARQHHPYRMWRKEVIDALNERFKLASNPKEVDVFLTPHGVWCRVCNAANYASCMLCGEHRDRWKALPREAREEFKSIMLQRRVDGLAAPIARDWSEEYMGSLPVGEKPS